MKKGFTLIELLAVIALMGILATITTVSIVKIRQTYTQNLYENKIKYVLEGAKEWGNDNLNKLSNTCTCRTIRDLIGDGYIKGDNDTTELIDPRNSGDLTKLNVCITYERIDLGTKNDIDYSDYQVISEIDENDSMCNSTQGE